jgi:hypothetical protein
MALVRLSAVREEEAGQVRGGARDGVVGWVTGCVYLSVHCTKSDRMCRLR